MRSRSASAAMRWTSTWDSLSAWFLRAFWYHMRQPNMASPPDSALISPIVVAGPSRA